MSSTISANEPLLANDVNFVDIINELYNISKDPQQRHDIYEEERDVARQLHAKLLRFLKEVGTKEEIIKYWEKL